MSDNFEWDDESTVVRSVSAIAVYLNPNSDVVIRQQHPYGEDDQVIILPADRAEDVASAIFNAAKAAQE